MSAAAVWFAWKTAFGGSERLVSEVKKARETAGELTKMAGEVEDWWKVAGSPEPPAVARFLEATFPDREAAVTGKAGTFTNELLVDVQKLGGVDGKATRETVEDALAFDGRVALSLGMTLRRHRRHKADDLRRLEEEAAREYGAYAGFLVGGPESNRASWVYLAEAAARTKRSFRFGTEDGWPFYSPTGEVYRPEKDGSGAYVKDYGLLMRVKNRKRPDLNTVLVMGPTRWGTFAASAPFTRPSWTRGKAILATLQDAHQDKEFFAVIGATFNDRRLDETWIEESIAFDHYKA